MEIDSNDRLVFNDLKNARYLFGKHDEHLKIIEKMLGVKINVRGNTLDVQGQDHDRDVARKLLGDLYHVVSRGYPIFAPDIEYAVKILSSQEDIDLPEVFMDEVFITAKNKLITPKSVNQKKYIDCIRRNDIVFAIGPAGTGKTYLAMAMAVSSLTKKKTDRIILTRPAVEAGEKLGFLPGTLYEKVNPYLRPLYDALHDMIELDRVNSMLESGMIEVAPLAFMRGRTLNDSFVILDEAQNTTSEQMKMFLTRLGFNSKAIITGDVTQIDLPADKVCGLVEAGKLLSNIKGISVVNFNEKDVVRHPLVQKIIKAYENRQSSASKRPGKRKI